MSEAMRIRGIAPWFGAKRTMAPIIVEELGDHAAYWEPFCGSMAVLMAKPVSKVEVVNDLHCDLVNLARVLQDPATAEDLYGRVALTLFHEEFLEEARTRLEAEASAAEPVSRAYWFLVASWFGRNGTAGQPLHRVGRSFCIRYSSRGGDAATRWRSVSDSIPAWHERLRAVTILNRDAFQLIPRIEDRQGTVIYCDPPYIEKSTPYEHDFHDGLMVGTNDHERLAVALRGFRHTRVVVSYYEHPCLSGLYAGWTQRRVKAVKFMNNGNPRAGSDGVVQAPEVLLINGPSYVQEAPPA